MATGQAQGDFRAGKIKRSRAWLAFFFNSWEQVKNNSFDICYSEWDSRRCRYVFIFGDQTGKISKASWGKLISCFSVFMFFGFFFLFCFYLTFSARCPRILFF